MASNDAASTLFTVQRYATRGHVMQERAFRAATTTERNVRSTEESLANRPLIDTEFLFRALLEYREATWDDSSFENLPSEAQHTILRRAQEIKELATRLRTASAQSMPTR